MDHVLSLGALKCELLLNLNLKRGMVRVNARKWAERHMGLLVHSELFIMKEPCLTPLAHLGKAWPCRSCVKLVWFDL
jgi:hypothetical protein